MCAVAPAGLDDASSGGGEGLQFEETALSDGDDPPSEDPPADPEDPDDRVLAHARDLVSIITGDEGSDDGDEEELPPRADDQDLSDDGEAGSAPPAPYYYLLHAEPTEKQLADLGQFDSKVLFYKDNLEKELYPGCRLSVQQAVYSLMDWKVNNAVTDKAFDAILAIVSAMLPEVSACLGLRGGGACCHQQQAHPGAYLPRPTHPLGQRQTVHVWTLCCASPFALLLIDRATSCLPATT